MRGFRSGKDVLPVGSWWSETAVDPKAVSGYRFDPSWPARLKTVLDIAAGVYVFLAAAALAASHSAADSGSSVLVAISDVFTLRPLLSRYGLEHIGRVPTGALVFVILAAGLVLHESRWLTEKIYYRFLLSGRAYEGFLPRRRFAPPPRWHRPITIASGIFNYVCFLGLVAIASRYLWDGRHSDIVRDPLVRENLVFGGALLTVMGGFNVVEALQEGETEPWREWIRGLIAGIVSGITFGAVIGIGLGRGWRQGALGFAFGLALVISVWAWRRVMARLGESHSFPKPLAHVGRYGVRIPLIALGRVIMIPLEWAVALVDAIQRRPEVTSDEPRSDLDHETFEQVGTRDGRAYGYLHRREIRLPPLTLERSLRFRLLRGLLKEDSWLTRWLKREPIRLLKGAHASLWEREDPLDFKGRVRVVGGSWPPFADLEHLSRRLLALMLAAFIVAYVAELAVGHVIAVVGAPLLARGLGFALVFGSIVGVLFAIVTILGRSSMGGLALGLLSGLSLEPTLGLTSGLAFRVGHQGTLLVVTFVLTILTGTLEKRALGVVGLLALGAGIYLQLLRSLS